MKEREKSKAEEYLDLAIKIVGLVILLFLIYSHVFIKEINIFIFGIPAAMIGLNVRDILKIKFEKEDKK